MNTTLEHLKELMTISANADKLEIKDRFQKIAEILKNKIVIKFNKDKNENKYDNEGKYRILDFEFYFYNQNHRDITTHPRNSKALSWYINDFGGIDLNFNSEIKPSEGNCFKYQLTEDAFFGGILIRRIQRLSDKFVYDGPLKVAELFRILDATTHQQNTPILDIAENELERLEFHNPQRHNILGSHKDVAKKVDYNIKSCFEGVDDSTKADLEEELGEILKLDPKESIRYRYCWKKNQVKK